MTDVLTPNMKKLSALAHEVQVFSTPALAAARRELAEEMKRSERFKKENERLRNLIRSHYRAVNDGIGNWGETEARLFKAVGR